MKIKLKGAFKETKKYRRQRLIRGLVIPEDTKVYAVSGINWVWYKAQTDNMVAVFRVHRGTNMEDDLHTIFSIDYIEELDVEGELIASHVSAQKMESGYKREDVKRNFEWLDKMFRENAEWGEKTLVGLEESKYLGHLNYHGVEIYKI